METWWQDIRYGARMLTRSPGFTTVAVLTLALGIGANTAIFSVINAVLLRALPYEEADRLVFLTEWSEQVPEMSFSVANLKDVRDQSTSFESLVGFNGTSFILNTEGAEAERLSGRQVSSGLFPTLRKAPVLGRASPPTTTSRGRSRWPSWPRATGSAGSAATRHGRPPPRLSGEPFTVVGIMPKTVTGAGRPSTSTRRCCASRTRSAARRTAATTRASTSSAALKPGITVERARTEVKGIAARLAEQHPNSNARQSMTLETLHQSYVGDLRPALMLLLGAVAFVLLIACGNVANLLLSRAAGRQKRSRCGARWGRRERASSASS
jgi:hypothetical protein